MQWSSSLAPVYIGGAAFYFGFWFPVLMWPVIVQFVRVYTPYIALPFAAIVGFVGLSLETKIRDKDRLSSASATPTKTFDEARLERRLGATDDDLPTNWEDVVTSPKLRYRRDPMFDKNK